MTIGSINTLNASLANLNMSRNSLHSHSSRARNQTDLFIELQTQISTKGKEKRILISASKREILSSVSGYKSFLLNLKKCGNVDM